MGPTEEQQRRNTVKLRNWIAALVSITLLAGGALVFAQTQKANASELKGTANNVTGTSVTVDSKTLTIDSNTEIVGQLASGSIVQIRARVQDDGNLLATRIVVKDGINGNHHDDDDDEIEGTIQSVGADNRSIVIGGHTILVDEHTKIDDGHLATSVTAEVEVTRLQNGSLLAKEIEIEDDDDDDEDDD